jgi:hypothetical protein
MNLVQKKKADEVNIDTVDGMNAPKKRSKKGFKGDAIDDTYEA